jgi:hypothetical protein
LVLGVGGSPFSRGSLALPMTGGRSRVAYAGPRKGQRCVMTSGLAPGSPPLGHAPVTRMEVYLPDTTRQKTRARWHFGGSAAGPQGGRMTKYRIAFYIFVALEAEGIAARACNLSGRARHAAAASHDASATAPGNHAEGASPHACVPRGFRA